MEVAAALRRSIRVIPVLVGSAPMPKGEELPDDLRGLVEREFVRVTREHFDGDVRRLIQAISSELPVDRWRTMPWRAAGLAALLAAFATAAYFVFFESSHISTTAGVSGDPQPKSVRPSPNAVASGPGAVAGSQAAAAEPAAGSNETTGTAPGNPPARAAATVAQNKPNHDYTTSPPTAPEVSGKWQTDYMKSPYDDSRYKLTFDFVQQEDMLVGTVSELIEGRRRAIERRIVDGRIRKNVLNFYTEGQVWYDDKLRAYKEGYTGVLVKKTNTIAFQRANDSPGGGDVEKFVAKRD
jgi:hypothetical protein